MSKNIKYTLLTVVFALIIFVFSMPREIARTPQPATAKQGTSRLSQLLGDDGDRGYAQVIDARVFEFPADHGPHPGYRNEWWYLTGNLDAVGGERFGYELTIFRFALSPGELRVDGSAWRSKQVFIGHFTISDIERDEFHVAQRYSRGSLGLAGASGPPLHVWVEDWSIAAMQLPGSTDDDTDYGQSWQLRAGDGDMALQLQLAALKAPVLQGQNGLSQKARGAGNASYYYSITRLQSDGTLTLGGQEYRVTGLSWLDREWSSRGLGAQQIGWDWFALQLSDGSELMFYDLRKMDGTRDSHSAGTLVRANGERIVLSVNTLSIDILEHWESPRGVRYPAAWRLRSSLAQLDLEIRPLMADQELLTTVQYWEGAVEVKGQHDGVAVAGRGYVELTGYAETDIH